MIAIGSPLGLAGTVTDGIVSALDRPVRLDGSGSDTNAVIDAIQTDAAINPGNSGRRRSSTPPAPSSASTPRSAASAAGEGGSIGLGFAIPIDDARDIAEELIRTGAVSHAELGDQRPLGHRRHHRRRPGAERRSRAARPRRPASSRAT